MLHSAAMPRVRVGELELFHDVEGAGDPILLLTGLGGDRHAWDLCRRDLARRHRLVLLDNRDAGESSEAAGSYALPDMAADAVGVMDHLGIERFHVVGASMGGAIAQHLALVAPTRVATMVLLGTWGRTDAFLRAVLGGWRILVERLAPEEFLAAISPWAFTYRFLESPSPEVVALQKGLRERGVLKSVPAYRRQLDACLAHDALGLLPLLRTPTLVLVGEDDLLTPPRYGRAIAAALARAEATLVPASGHASFLETPKAVVERTLRFLSKHPVGG
jgi:3-oxoadipate enol-lactonase